MLVSLHLEQYVEIRFKNFLPIRPYRYRKTFVCLCRQTLRPIHTIFKTVYSISDINNIDQFQDIWRIFTRVRAYIDRQTDKLNAEIIFNFVGNSQKTEQ